MSKRHAFESESDSNSINTTTTEEPDVDEEKDYPVERVLDERVSGDETTYLIKWEGYPLHESTYEPTENVDDEVIEEWISEKLAIKQGKKVPFDIKVYEDAVAKFQQGQAEKKRKREAKKQKRECERRADAGEESEGEVLGQSPTKGAKIKSQPVKRKGVAQVQPAVQRKPQVIIISDGDDSDDDDDEAMQESDDEPLFLPSDEEMEVVEGYTAVSKTDDPEMPTIQPAQKRKAANAEMASVTSTPLGQQRFRDQGDTTKTAPTPSKAQAGSPSKVPTAAKVLPTTTAARKTAPAMPPSASTATNSSKPAPKKRLSDSKVFAGDWAKDKKRRQRVRVSGETPKDSSDSKFKRLSIQNRYQNYGKNEPAPDINALTIVDPKTGTAQAPTASTPAMPTEAVGPAGASATRTMAKDPGDPTTKSMFSKTSSSTPATNIPSKVLDKATSSMSAEIASKLASVYGRRSPPRESRRRSPSPSATMENRADPDLSLRPAAVRNTSSHTYKTQPPPLPPELAKRITCKDWQGGNCRYPADKCIHAHAYPSKESGIVATYNKLRICYYWQHGGCKYQNEDDCSFAHSNTGINADKPYGRDEPVRKDPSTGRDLAPKDLTCYYWKTTGSCRKTAEECDFAHYDTGIVADPPGTRKLGARLSASWLAYDHYSPADNSMTVPTEPAPREAQALQSTTVGGDTFVQSPTALGNVQNDNVIDTTGFDSNVPRSKVVSVPKDKITNSAPASPRDIIIKTNRSSSGTFLGDPRIRPQVQAAPPALPPVEMELNNADQNFFTSIERDIEMAELGRANLDASYLLKTKDGAIENVCIYMPKERHTERVLIKAFLEKYTQKRIYVATEDDPSIWEFFRNTYGKNALLVLHPSELFNGTVPKLHHFLFEHGANARVFSVGVQHELCMREGRAPRYEAQRLFPHAGITFITDDIFVYYPEKAAEIINTFLKSAQNKPPGAEMSKIGARPGIKDWMVRLAQKKFEEQGGEGKCTDLRWIECYEALCRLCPPEDEDWNYPSYQVPLDSSYLWSPWEGSLPSFKGRWESGDEAGATDYMANFFAGEACSKVWKYRKFLFVYQRPEHGTKVDSQGQETVQQSPEARKWMEQYSHIGVVNPEQALRSMKKK